MKKRLLFVAAIFAATATFAQDGLTSKKGEAYLPEAGDWSIGIDANPLINYVGNLANGNTGNSFGGATWFDGSRGDFPAMTIYGKYFKDEKTAYRAMVRIGFGSTKSGSVNEMFTDSLSSYNGTTTEFTDEVKTASRQITLGFGLEKRRGNTRIQGVYGAQMMIGFGGSSTENTYGLAFGAANTISETSGYVINDVDPLNPFDYYGSSERTTKVDNGSTFMIGLQGFIGVEWFFAPKVSLGAEYSWGLSMTSTGASKTDTERWGVTPAESVMTTVPARHLVTKTYNGAKSSSFGIDTGLSGANISLNFHF